MYTYVYSIIFQLNVLNYFFVFKVWLEPTKLISKQVRSKLAQILACWYNKHPGLILKLFVFLFFCFPGPANTLFRLAVKFFPPDPGQLQEEFTRSVALTSFCRETACSLFVQNEQFIL